MAPEGGYYNNRLMWFQTREALEEERAVWRARLAGPQFRELEAYFGDSAPPALRSLYETFDVAATDGFVVAEALGERIRICVWPADVRTVEECWARVPGHFPFAESVGSFYSVRFGANSNFVYFTELGSSAAVEVGASLTAFIVGISS
jgi:hypothetical protein